MAAPRTTMEARKRPSSSPTTDITETELVEIKNFGNRYSSHEIARLLTYIADTEATIDNQKDALLKTYQQLKNKTAGYSQEITDQAGQLVKQAEEKRVPVVKMAIETGASTLVINFLIDVLNKPTHGGSAYSDMFSEPRWNALEIAYRKSPDNIELINMLLTYSTSDRPSLFRIAVVDARIALIERMFALNIGFTIKDLISELDFRNNRESYFDYVLDTLPLKLKAFVPLFSHFMDAIIVSDAFHSFLDNAIIYVERMKGNHDAIWSLNATMALALSKLFSKDKVAYDKTIQHLCNIGFDNIVFILMQNMIMNPHATPETKMVKMAELWIFVSIY